MDIANYFEDYIFDFSEMPQTISLILSFFSYDELAQLDAHLRRRYHHFSDEMIANVMKKDLLWFYINLHLTTTRNITLNLHEDSPLEPSIICPIIERRANFAHIHTLYLNICFNFDNFDCPLAMHDYDFRYLINLKNLSIENALIEFIQINPTKLISLRLKNVHYTRNRNSYSYAFNDLLSNGTNLQILQLDNFPERFETNANILQHLALSHTYVDVHRMAEFLLAHNRSLHTIRFNIYGSRLINLLLFLNSNIEFVFPHVHTLIFHFSDLDELQHKSKLPLTNMVFPNLKRLNFAISSPEQLLKCIPFCIYPGIRDIMLRPEPNSNNSLPFISTDAFNTELNQLNMQLQGRHTISYMPLSICATH